MAELTLPDDLAVTYIGALITIARTDGDIGFEESRALNVIAARRSKVPVDEEVLFFGAVTPEALRAALGGGGPHRSGIDGREVGLALIHDAMELAATDGELNGAEATMILRFARALGCSNDDIRAQTNELDEWLDRIAH
jgi:uncharacterized tellurite resistance protein B-like protein